MVRFEMENYDINREAAKILALECNSRPFFKLQ